ncbi:GTP-sensing pleiotropic transcriptional regulator CodY [Defluviitalea phaphyphila]|uniref:GTP-sensing pleiotropic transcriptional regulator CodY n=1 Tax=Defluviitalea phaphyphila TaxID=1473580 RepID=UPI000731D71C|nr:GTP-sensing pleiotropic transcriptional regulator CodY [Defluviitalea phaphyphila]
MSVELLEKTRKVNRLLQHSGSDPVIFNDICKVLSEVLSSNSLIISKKGKILGIHYIDSSSVLLNAEEDKLGSFIESQFNDKLLNIIETKENILLSEFNLQGYQNDISKYNSTIIPISAGGERLGTLLLYKEEGEYITEDLILGEYGATVVGLEILRSQSEETAEEIRKTTIVKSAIGTLSYSELEAILHIFEELNGSEGLLVASKIADRVGITRSVIVNALRKFESAGVIESRSLGMKGTYIKVLNDVLLDELNKLRR